MYNASRILLGYGVIIRKRGAMSAEQDEIGKIGYVESDSRRGVEVSYSLDGLNRKIDLSFAEIGRLLTLGTIIHDDVRIILVSKEPSSLEDEIEKASKRWTSSDVSFPHLAQIAKHFYNLGRNETYIKADKVTLYSHHEVVDTISATTIAAIQACFPNGEDLILVRLKDGRKLYCDSLEYN